MNEQPESDIQYVRKKVDEIDSGISVLKDRPVGKDRTGLYCFVVSGLFFAYLMGKYSEERFNQVDTNQTQIETKVDAVQNKLDTLEQLLKDLKNEDK